MPGRLWTMHLRESKFIAQASKGNGERVIAVLTDVLANTRTSTLIYGRLELSAPWGLDFPADGAAHLYVVAQGGARLELAGAAPLVLSAGDVAFLPHGERHVLRDGPRSPLHTLSGCRGEQMPRRRWKRIPALIAGPATRALAFPAPDPCS